jgi:hypothetical protein
MMSQAGEAFVAMLTRSDSKTSEIEVRFTAQSPHKVGSKIAATITVAENRM